MSGKQVMSLPSFLLYTLPDGILVRRDGFGSRFEPLTGVSETLDDLEVVPGSLVFVLPDGRYACYSNEVFALEVTFPCPFCKKSIDLDALTEYLRTSEGIQAALRIFERLLAEVRNE